MNWKIKATLQKILSLTRTGDQLNHVAATLNKDYHSNVFQYQTHESLRKINDCNININEEATALEIGTGYSIFSAITLSLLGFNKVVTVDVTNDLKVSSFKKQIQYLNSTSFLEKIISRSIYSEDVIKEKIQSIKKVTSLKNLFEELNIIYIAPYQFKDIENEHSSFDYITSQVVLEHMPTSELNILFQKTKKWLTPHGFAVHTINFIDHFANPGFFQDKSISEFNFLKYSDKYWNFWAGNSIAYTNRLSYLYYEELAKKHQLEVIDFKGENYRKHVELNTSLIHTDIINKYHKIEDLTKLTKYQRGTLILSP